MTMNGTQRVQLSLGDWLRLIGLTATIVGGLIATLWRQEGLIRDVQQNQRLLEYRVTQLEQSR
jgi:hypothetical protein